MSDTSKTYAYEDLDLSAEPWVSYLWGVADQEHLDLDPYDTIEAALDVEADLEDLPETIELHPWVRHVPTEGEIQGLVDVILDDVFERLDERYGNPDGDREEPGERDRREALRFVNGVVGRLFIWRCDPVPEIVEVDVERWIRENRSDWLSDEPDQGIPATVADVEAAAVEDAFGWIQDPLVIDDEVDPADVEAECRPSKPNVDQGGV